VPIDSDGPITLSSGALNIGDHTGSGDSIYHGPVTAAMGTVLWVTGGGGISTFLGSVDADYVRNYSGTAFNYEGQLSQPANRYISGNELHRTCAGIRHADCHGNNKCDSANNPLEMTFDTLNVESGIADFHEIDLNLQHLRVGRGGSTSETILRAGDISVANSFDWGSGTLTGPGTDLSLAVGSETTFFNVNGAGGVFWELNGRTLNNHGTVHLVTNPWLRTILFSGGSTLNNYGTLRSDSLYNFELRTSGTGETFNNYGTVTQAGSGGINGSLVFNNFGTVNVDTEYMTFDGGGTNAGTIIGASGTKMRFSGTTSLQPGSMITSDGDVEFNDMLIDQIAGHSGAGNFGTLAPITVNLSSAVMSL
jgi:hypothetical protein